METEPFLAQFELRYTYKRSLGPVLSAFFTALRDARILGARTAGGRVLVPPCEYDPDTGADIVGLVHVGPEGTVTSWAGVTAGADGPPAVGTPQGGGGVQPPSGSFAWALVRLDGADTAMLHRVATGGAELRTGSRVRPRWAAERTGEMADISFFEVVDGPVRDRVLGERNSGAHPAPQGSARGGIASVAPPDTHPAAPRTTDLPGVPVTLLRTPTCLAYQVTAGEVTTRFLTAIMERKLVGQRCPACRKVYIPPRGSCPTCAVPTAQAVAVGPCGTVTTFSIVRLPFEGQLLDPPYACAHVVMDGADVPLLHIIGECAVEHVRIGMRVEAVWAAELAPTLASVRYFRPVDQPDVPDDAMRVYL